MEKNKFQNVSIIVLKKFFYTDRRDRRVLVQIFLHTKAINEIKLHIFLKLKTFI